MSCPDICHITIAAPGPQACHITVTTPGAVVAQVLIADPTNPGVASQLAPGFRITFSPPDHTATHAIVHYLGIPIASIPLSALP